MEGSRMKYRIALAISLFALSAGSYATTLCQEKNKTFSGRLAMPKTQQSEPYQWAEQSAERSQSKLY